MVYRMYGMHGIHIMQRPLPSLEGHGNVTPFPLIFKTVNLGVVVVERCNTWPSNIAEDDL